MKVQWQVNPSNLLPVESSLNQSKGAKPPSEWLPPEGQCNYVLRFNRVAKKYSLELSASEQRFIDAKIQSCGTR